MKPTTRELFVKQYSPFINKLVAGTGIFPGTLIAQAIIESSGKYNTGGNWLVGGSKLAQEANNFFGIKATPSWKGGRYNINTGEYTPEGKAYTEAATFRAYKTPEDSMKDYVNFLQVNSRYTKAGVFKAKTVEEQAAALKISGYSTAPNYAKVVNDVYVSVKDFISEKKSPLA